MFARVMSIHLGTQVSHVARLLGKEWTEEGLANRKRRKKVLNIVLEDILGWDMCMEGEDTGDCTEHRENCVSFLFIFVL